MSEKTSVLDLLLKPETPNVRKSLPTARYRVKESMSEDLSVHIVLSGVVSPDLKDPALQAKFGGATPAETVKALLLPGEIEDLSRAVERLCGYRTATIEEVKNA